MSHNKYVALTGELYRYVVEHSCPPDEILSDLIRETEEEIGGLAIMQIAPDQGAFMTMLARISGARRAIEVGTFTGYSALCIARGLAPDGHLLACDVSEEWTAIAQKYWERAGLSDRIELRLGPALDTLRGLPEEEVFDLAFIDADKSGYPDYYEEVLRRTTPGGLILLDNVFWMGTVADPSYEDAEVRLIRDLNDRIAADERVDSVMLPLSDGLTLVRKR